MSRDAMLPCFACGKTLRNMFDDAENQPDKGTEFRTYGHYGSTFWDSFDGEELVLTVCDDCLAAHTERLAQHKRFQPLVHARIGRVGRQWLDRPMVPYTGNPDDTLVRVSTEDIGSPSLGSNIEWDDVADLKAYAEKLDDAD